MVVEEEIHDGGWRRENTPGMKRDDPGLLFQEINKIKRE